MLNWNEPEYIFDGLIYRVNLLADIQQEPLEYKRKIVYNPNTLSLICVHDKIKIKCRICVFRVVKKRKTPYKKNEN